MVQFLSVRSGGHTRVCVCVGGGEGAPHGERVRNG